MSVVSLRIFSAIFLALSCGRCVTEKVRYLITERPNLIYWSPKYLTYYNVTCKRYGRSDPVYYFNIHLNSRYVCNNNLSIDYYFYEFLSNQYKRSFVEMHFKVCDLIRTGGKFFGNIFNQGILRAGCPIPPGPIALYNLSVPARNIPHNFPFTKGRIYVNVTSTDTDDLVVQAHVDMEIKEFNLKKRKPRSSSRQ